MNSLATFEANNNNLLVILCNLSQERMCRFVTLSSRLKKMPQKWHSGLARNYSFSSDMWQKRCTNNKNLFRGVCQLRHKLQVSVTSVYIH